MIKCLKGSRGAISSKILGNGKKEIFDSSVELYMATYFKNDFSQMLILSCGTFLSSIFRDPMSFKNFSKLLLDVQTVCMSNHVKNDL